MPLPEQKFPCDGWRFVEVLGKGTTGQVSLWENRLKSHKLAVKVCIDDPKVSKYSNLWLHEVYTTGRLCHPNIVRGLALPDEIRESIPHRLIPLVMEYCEGGNLRDLIKTNPNGVPERELRFFLLDVCRGLKYLHQKHILHGKLTPENIVIKPGQRRIFKICDLGYMRIILTNPASTGRPSADASDWRVISKFRVKFNYTWDYLLLGLTAFEAAAGHRPCRDFLPPWLPETCALSEDFYANLQSWLMAMVTANPKSRECEEMRSTLDRMIDYITGRTRHVFDGSPDGEFEQANVSPCQSF